MMKSILVCLILIQKAVLAQLPPKEYFEYVRTADSLYQIGKYRESAFMYTDAFRINKWKGYIPDICGAARAWAMIDNYDSAFRKLDRVVTYADSDFKKYRELPQDPALISLHHDGRWKLFVEKVNKKFKNPIVLQLDTILFDDQRYRLAMDSVGKKFGVQSEEARTLFEKMKKVDAANLLKVKKIISENGWPGVSDVGREGNNAIFLVLQHADPATQEEYLPMFQQAVRDGKALPSQLAYFEDRIAIQKGEKQTYGTQIGFDNKTGKYNVLPLNNPEMVDVRRRQAGLPPLAEYLKQWGITWDAEEYKKSLEKE